MGIAADVVALVVVGLVGLFADMGWLELALATKTPPVKPAIANKNLRRAILRFTYNLQRIEI
jgi:hypothetical protein